MSRHARSTPHGSINQFLLDESFFSAEIDANRRSEWWLISQAILALSIVVVLVVLRQLFLI